MNPVLIEVIRGGRVESFHRGAAAVIDADGTVVHRIGDIDRPIFPRSAVKPLQALPLVASGAADQFGLTDAEIALACGSHTGEPLHVATAESMLRKAGFEALSLECGTHWPFSDTACRALAAAGGFPSSLHNNCSGKHAGLLCLARFRGHDASGYVQPNHPAMREMTTALAAATGVTLDDACLGIDGCSFPTFAMPLRAIATGFARLGTGRHLTIAHARAASRIRSAIASQPLMVAGSDRFDTLVAMSLGEAVLCKSGAEGTAAAAIPGLGYGVAVKIDDGGCRAAEVAMANLLQRLLPVSLVQKGGLANFAKSTVLNWNRLVVGSVQAM